MNPLPCLHPALLAGLAIFTFAGSAAKAQLNESKIERDASGVYNGKISGGKLVLLNPPNPPSEPSSIPPTAGRLRVPVKNGKVQSLLSDSDLPGNDKARCSGRWQKTDVRRGGRLIALQGAGSVDEDDGGNGPWENGRLTGTLTDKGPKWHGKAVVKSATKTLAGGGLTDKLTGLVISGRD